jgi:membrane protein CcdC involved in cytochrome C biogenesis
MICLIRTMLKNIISFSIRTGVIFDLFAILTFTIYMQETWYLI